MWAIVTVTSVGQVTLLNATAVNCQLVVKVGGPPRKPQANGRYLYTDASGGGHVPL